MNLTCMDMGAASVHTEDVQCIYIYITIKISCVAAYASQVARGEAMQVHTLAKIFCFASVDD